VRHYDAAAAAAAAADYAADDDSHHISINRKQDFPNHSYTCDCPPNTSGSHCEQGEVSLCHYLIPGQVDPISCMTADVFSVSHLAKRIPTGTTLILFCVSLGKTGSCSIFAAQYCYRKSANFKPKRTAAALRIFP